MPTGAALGCPSKDDVAKTTVGTFSNRSFTSWDMTAMTLPFSPLRERAVFKSTIGILANVGSMQGAAMTDC